MGLTSSDFQACADEGYLHFPAGAHSIATPLVLPDRCVVEAHPLAVITGDPVFQGSGFLKRVRVEGGEWRGRLLRQYGVVAYGTFRDMFVRNGLGFRMDGAIGCLWDRVEFGDSDGGILFDGEGAVNQNFWRECRWVRVRAGVALLTTGPLRYNHFDGCWWEPSTGFAIKAADHAEALTVSRSWIEDVEQGVIGPVTVTETRV